jgi:hypothetical protein
MQVEVVTGSITEISCDALIVNLFEGASLPAGATGAVDAALDGQIAAAWEAPDPDPSASLRHVFAEDR